MSDEFEDLRTQNLVSFNQNKTNEIFIVSLFLKIESNNPQKYCYSQSTFHL